MQDVVLALLAKEPSYGYQLKARLRDALGPLGEAMNAGQIYVTLARLEKAGLVRWDQSDGLPDRPDRPDRRDRPRPQGLRAHPARSAPRRRLITEVSWPKLAPTEFHLKLVAAAAARLADPVALVDAQVQDAVLNTARGSGAIVGGGAADSDLGPPVRAAGQKPKLGARQVQLARQMYDERGDDGKRRCTVAQIAAEFGRHPPHRLRHLDRTVAAATS